MSSEFRITAYGHPNLKGDHKTTWQLTTEDYVTSRGDCIIAVSATSAAADFPEWLKDHLKQAGDIQIQITNGPHEFRGVAKGHAELSFKDTKDMVFRKSSFVCDRTVAIGCNFVARDLPRDLIVLNPSTPLTIIIKATPIDNLS